MKTYCALAVLLLMPAVSSATDSDYRYLAANPELRADLQNASAVMGQAQYVGKMLERDQSWEADYKLIYPGSIVIAPDTGQWRMYYEMAKSNKERCVAMATSDDGINWTKPALNVTGTTYASNANNNFINLPQTWMKGPCVFVDPTAPADQRYRMSVSVNEAVMYSLTSPDGVNFQHAGTIYVKGSESIVLDSHNTSFWDPATGQYAAYMRWWYPADGGSPARRGVFAEWSADWEGTWDAAREFTIDPKDVYGPGVGKPDIYTPGVMPYHGQYVGLPAIFFHPGGQDGALYPTFMHSNDGSDWHFEDGYQPIIDLAAHGQNETTFGMAFPATSVVEADGELYVYYSYFQEQHHETRSSGEVHLAKLRADGFVGIESAPGEIGTWTTSEITLPDEPGRLVVNSIVGEGGSLLVELLDPLAMQALEGFAADDGLTIGPGDYIDERVLWQGISDLNSLSGRTVALRFVLDGATIYSFSFQRVPEPSTLALLAAGAVALLWRVRRKIGRLSQ